MKKSWAPMLAFATLALAGCGTGEDSSDVNQDRIYTGYEVFYNSNEDKTHVIAHFRFDPTQVTIVQHSKKRSQVAGQPILRATPRTRRSLDHR